MLKPSLFLGAFAAGAAAILATYWVGYFAAASDYKKIIADGKAAFARRISAANAQTRATKVRLAGELQQSEAKIDELGQKYRDALAKLTENTCPLSDDDMLRLWNGGAGNPRVKPSNQRRLRPVAGQGGAS